MEEPAWCKGRGINTNREPTQKGTHPSVCCLVCTIRGADLCTSEICEKEQVGREGEDREKHRGGLR